MWAQRQNWRGAPKTRDSWGQRGAGLVEEGSSPEPPEVAQPLGHLYLGLLAPDWENLFLFFQATRYVVISSSSLWKLTRASHGWMPSESRRGFRGGPVLSWFPKTFCWECLQGKIKMYLKKHWFCNSDNVLTSDQEKQQTSIRKKAKIAHAVTQMSMLMPTKPGFPLPLGSPMWEVKWKPRGCLLGIRSERRSVSKSYYLMTSKLTSPKHLF